MQKFLVAGMPRSGSTLVATTLAQHMNITIHGELFHPVSSERAGSHSIKIDEGKYRFFDPNVECSTNFLRNEVWNRDSTEKDAIGFKLFGEYIALNENEELFTNIIDNFPEIKMIVIWRKNLLDCLISRKVAELSGDWIKYSSDFSHNKIIPKFIIDKKSALEFFYSYNQVNLFLGMISKKISSFVLDYDDFVANFYVKSAEMFDFLGLKPAPVSMALKKQALLRQSDYIENWNDLKSEMEGTPFFFHFRD